MILHDWCVCVRVRACVRAYMVCVSACVGDRDAEREREKLQKSVSSKKRNKRQKLHTKKVCQLAACFSVDRPEPQA